MKERGDDRNGCVKYKGPRQHRSGLIRHILLRKPTAVSVPDADTEEIKFSPQTETKIFTISGLTWERSRSVESFI